ncbi:hypothetical protein ACE6H2_016585 [Prunus campanulata]
MHTLGPCYDVCLCSTWAAPICSIGAAHIYLSCVAYLLAMHCRELPKALLADSIHSSDLVLLPMCTTAAHFSCLGIVQNTKTMSWPMPLTKGLTIGLVMFKAATKLIQLNWKIKKVRPCLDVVSKSKPSQVASNSKPSQVVSIPSEVKETKSQTKSSGNPKA